MNLSLVSTSHPAPSATRADSWTDAIAALLPASGVFDTRELLDRHPEWRQDKSLVLDVVYEEHCRRKAAGEVIDPNEFCKRFPSYQASVCRLLQVSDFLDDEIMFAPDDHFLGFRLVRTLGRGRFAHVYLATEPEVGDRQVAVKISHHGSVEARTLGRLKHPNVIEIYSVQTDPRSALSAVCMPYHGSATLLDVLDRIHESGKPPVAATLFRDVIEQANAGAVPVENPLPADPLLGKGAYADAVARMGAELADALHYVHLHNVYHQDFKPSNVLLASGGRPLLLDFNLSVDRRLVDSLRGGTPAYMAPEQLRVLLHDTKHDNTPADARSDVFALGVVLYELLCGRHPFGPIEPVSPIELADRLLGRMSGALVPPKKSNSRVSRRLSQIVEQCLRIPIVDRPRTAADVAVSLRACLPFGLRVNRLWISHPIRATAGVFAITASLTGSAAWALNGMLPNHDAHIETGVVPSTESECLTYAKQLQDAGDFEEALRYYGRSGTLLNDPHIASNVGYCNSRTERHAHADHRYAEAVKAGEDTPAVWNNRGYSLMEHKRPKDQWIVLALQAFNRALELEPNSQTAHYNRALLLLELVGLRLGSRTPVGVPDTADAAREALCNIREALRLGPASAEMLLAAARIAASAYAHEEALRYLDQAIARGIDPRQRTLDKDRSLPNVFKADGRFGDIMNRPWSGRTPDRTDRLINPAYPR